MPHLWEAHVLLQSHQLDKGRRCMSLADPNRKVSELADLLDHAKDVGGTSEKAQQLSGPLTCQSLASVCALSLHRKGKHQGSADPLLCSCRTALCCAWAMPVSAHICLSSHTFGFSHPKQAFLSSSEEMCLHKAVSILRTTPSHWLMKCPDTQRCSTD